MKVSGKVLASLTTATLHICCSVLHSNKPAVHEVETSATGHAVLSVHLQIWQLLTPAITYSSVKHVTTGLLVWKYCSQYHVLQGSFPCFALAPYEQIYHIIKHKEKQILK